MIIRKSVFANGTVDDLVCLVNCYVADSIDEWGKLVFDVAQEGKSALVRLYTPVDIEHSAGCSMRGSAIGEIEVHTHVGTGGPMLTLRCLEWCQAEAQRWFDLLLGEMRRQGWEESVRSDERPGAPVKMRRRPSGRPSDPAYDQAFARLEEGKTRAEAFDWFCEFESIECPDTGIKTSFNAAMRRRGKP